MKNLFLLPTDKPSRLAYYQESTSYNKPILQLVNTTSSDYKYQHIYITSDEEIKDGEYGICLNLVREGFKSHQAVFKMDAEQRQAMEDLGGQRKAEVHKVILTTDQDLIKDGVQAVEEDFLKWFVKNPSCDRVDVKKQYITPLGDIVDFCYDNERLNYKIIIPKENLNKNKI